MGYMDSACTAIHQQAFSAKLINRQVDKKTMTTQPTSQPFNAPRSLALSTAVSAGDIAAAPKTDQDHASPLNHKHLEELAKARKRAKKIRRAASVAAFSGWSTLGFGLLTLPFGIFSTVALLLGIALSIIGFVELKGRTQLLSFNPKALKHLALNQVAFACVLIAYAGWSLYSGLTSPSQIASVAGTQGMAGLENIESLEHLLTLAIYGGLILGTIIFQGGAALYYATRSKYMRRYINNTPQWVLELQRNQSSSI